MVIVGAAVLERALVRVVVLLPKLRKTSKASALSFSLNFPSVLFHFSRGTDVINIGSQISIESLCSFPSVVGSEDKCALRACWPSFTLKECNIRLIRFCSAGLMVFSALLQRYVHCGVVIWSKVVWIVRFPPGWSKYLKHFIVFFSNEWAYKENNKMFIEFICDLKRLLKNN